MKTLDFKELKKMDMKRLMEELGKAKKELFKVNFDVRNGQSKNSHLIGNYKKYIAQISTLLNREQEEKPEEPNK